MSFLVGIFLLLGMREEEAFWAFVALVKNCGLSGLFTGELPLLNTLLYQLDRLVELRLPRLFSHFKAENVSPLLFASEWFSTLFCYGFALPTSLRVWDLFIVHGTKFLLRAAVAMLRCCEAELLRRDFDGMMLYFKSVGKTVRCSELIATAQATQLDDELLERLENEYAHPSQRKWAESSLWA